MQAHDSLGTVLLIGTSSSMLVSGRRSKEGSWPFVRLIESLFHSSFVQLMSSDMSMMLLASRMISPLRLSLRSRQNMVITAASSHFVRLAYS